MNRRQFLALVSSAPLAGVLAPWKPPPQTWHVWQIPSGWSAIAREGFVSSVSVNNVPLNFLGSVAIREGDDIAVTGDGRVIVNGIGQGPM